MEINFNSIYSMLKKVGIDKDYTNLIENKIDQIEEKNIIKLLSLAALLIDKEENEYKKLAYYIILKYSINFNDYTPLYEVSYKLFNMPVIEMLDRINNAENEVSLMEELYEIIKDKCKEKDLIYTGKQKKMKNEFFDKDIETSVVAPTSFGKTELLKEYIYKNYETKNICVILPSKAMINQLKIDLLNMFKQEQVKPKIITHYDINLSSTQKHIFVFTQERLFKFIYDRRKEILFDTLLVDEAHNVFQKDNRNKLLARMIILLKNKNPNLIIKYFSPVIEDYNNINFKYLLEDYEIHKSLVVNPLIKIEEISYISYVDKEKRIYDQFFNKFIPTGKAYENEYDYIRKEGKNKNIIYLNKPRECIDRAYELYKDEAEVEELKDISRELQRYIHEDYDLAELVKKGIVYHNGIVPENVRLYLESIIRGDHKNNIKYIFANSTLLEGVNMPFDSMFIMDICRGKGNMKYQDLKNLIGRVNRYSLIFNKENNDVQKLLPNIHFVKTASKEGKNFEDFIEENLKIDSKSKKRKDLLENPLLKSVKTDDINEKNIIDNLENKQQDENEIKTEIGKFCLEANVTDFDIVKEEIKLQESVEELRNSTNTYNIVQMIYKIFVQNINFFSAMNDLQRLKYEKTQNFYLMFLAWKGDNVSYNEMINKMLNYWKETNLEYLYLGSKWGECKRSNRDKIANYVRLYSKSDKDKANYAIKKIKIENDFVEYSLMKYIEILYKLALISQDEFNKIKYGTTNEIQIYFQMEGLSNELSKILVEKYSRYIVVKENGEYEIIKEIINEFNENNILKVELEYYI